MVHRRFLSSSFVACVIILSATSLLAEATKGCVSCSKNKQNNAQQAPAAQLVVKGQKNNKNNTI